MKRRPEFTIIAGPNGASKSRLGIFYSTVKDFDWDLLAMSLRNELLYRFASQSCSGF